MYIHVHTCIYMYMYLPTRGRRWGRHRRRRPSRASSLDSVAGLVRIPRVPTATNTSTTLVYNNIVRTMASSSGISVFNHNCQQYVVAYTMAIFFSITKYRLLVIDIFVHIYRLTCCELCGFTYKSPRVRMISNRAKTSQTVFGSYKMRFVQCWSNYMYIAAVCT